MSLRRSVSELWTGIAVAFVCVVAVSSPVAAQSAPPPQEAPVPAPAAAPSPEPAGPNTGRITLTAGVDVATAYVFRGIQQDDKGFITWPALDVGVTLAQGDGALSKVSMNLGLWNSMHTGPTGSDGPADDAWYESDFYASMTFGFGAFSVGPIYTAYTSPNKTFGTVTEIAFKAAFADAKQLGRFALSPYALVAFEIEGGADGGERSGKYLELGMAPGVPLAGGKASLTFPVKLGLSLADYYEGPSTNDTFGYLDTGIAASIPLSFVSRNYGSWTLRGAVDLLTLGDNTQLINRGDGTKVVGQFGVGLSY